jgi:hypothetical protein
MKLLILLFLTLYSGLSTRHSQEQEGLEYQNFFIEDHQLTAEEGGQNLALNPLPNSISLLQETIQNKDAIFLFQTSKTSLQRDDLWYQVPLNETFGQGFLSEKELDDLFPDLKGGDGQLQLDFSRFAIPTTSNHFSQNYPCQHGALSHRQESCLLDGLKLSRKANKEGFLTLAGAEDLELSKQQTFLQQPNDLTNSFSQITGSRRDKSAKSHKKVRMASTNNSFIVTRKKGTSLGSRKKPKRLSRYSELANIQTKRFISELRKNPEFNEVDSELAIVKNQFNDAFEDANVLEAYESFLKKNSQEEGEKRLTNPKQDFLYKYADKIMKRKDAYYGTLIQDFTSLKHRYYSFIREEKIKEGGGRKIKKDPA